MSQHSLTHWDLNSLHKLQSKWHAMTLLQTGFAELGSLWSPWKGGRVCLVRKNWVGNVNSWASALANIP